MLGKQLQFAAARRFSALPLALVLVFGGFGAPLASARVTELEENSPAKVRTFEELSHGQRINPQRQLRVESGRITAALTHLSPRSLGHTQNPVLSSAGGHRLPNGLLAPLTC